MNDTTSSPEEPDDRGVATGQQATSKDSGPAKAAPAAGSDGNGKASAAEGADAPTARIRLPKISNVATKEQHQPTGAAPATVNSMPAAPAPAWAGDGSQPTAAGAPSGRSSVPAPGAPTVDPVAPRPGLESGPPDAAGPPEPGSAAATDGSTVVGAPIPSSTSANSEGARGSGVAGAADRSAANSSAPSAGAGSVRPTPEPRTPPKAAAAAPPAPPATGPIPHPGRGAANPPPWNRVPGSISQSAERTAPQQPQGPAGGLLDDGPTAYLMPDSASDDTSESQVKSWSPVRAGRTRPPRRAALQLKRLDPWSMLKLGLVLAVVIFFIWLVAVGVLYGVLDGMGVWDRLNGTYADLVSGEAPTGSPLISAGRVFGLAAVIGAINSLLFAVAVTIGAFVYNVSADLVGGIEVTLSERD